jgi:tRNA A22 N-methylase
MQYEEEFERLLGLMVRLVESTEGKEIPPDEEWHEYSNAFAVKLVHHLGTAYYIAKGTNLILEDKLHQYVDHSSFKVIIRSILETYLAFYFIIIAPPTNAERRFRFNIWQLGGFLERQNSPVITAEGKLKLLSEKAIVEKMLSDVTSDPLYKKLDKDLKKKAREGEWRLGRGWPRLAAIADINQNYFKAVYRYLCGYAHSGHLSLFQIKQSESLESQTDHIKHVAGIGVMIMSHFCFAYSGLYPEAGSALEADPEAKFIAEVFHFKSKDMEHIYGKG